MGGKSIDGGRPTIQNSVGGILMRPFKNEDSVQRNAKLLTQEEVNNNISKRLAREKRRSTRELEQERLKFEVMGKLQNENIPLEFTSFILVSENAKRTQETLDSFITTWRRCVKTK